MDLASTVHDLYGVPPTRFVAARSDRAQQAAAEDKALGAAIKRLPKPSMAAYVVNRLVRERHDQVEQLVELGAALREAQGGLDGAELRRLDQQRRQLTRAVAAEGLALAREHGQSVSAAAAAQVDETLHAAMADPDAAEAVLTGRLVTALSATGFGPVDLTDAVAAPDALASVTSLTDRRAAAAKAEAERALVAARAEAAAAEHDAREAAEQAAAARDRLESARTRRTELKDEVRRLREALDAAEQALDHAKADVRSAQRAADRAEADEAEATEAAAQAAAAVAELSGR